MSGNDEQQWTDPDLSNQCLYSQEFYPEEIILDYSSIYTPSEQLASGIQQHIPTQPIPVTLPQQPPFFISHQPSSLSMAPHLQHQPLSHDQPPSVIIPPDPYQLPTIIEPFQHSQPVPAQQQQQPRIQPQQQPLLLLHHEPINQQPPSVVKPSNIMPRHPSPIPQSSPSAPTPYPVYTPPPLSHPPSPIPHQPPSPQPLPPNPSPFCPLHSSMTTDVPIPPRPIHSSMTPEGPIPPPLPIPKPQSLISPPIALESAMGRPSTSSEAPSEPFKPKHSCNVKEVSAMNSANAAALDLKKLKVFARRFKEQRELYSYSHLDVVQQVYIRYQFLLREESIASFEAGALDLAEMTSLKKHLEQWLLDTARTRGQNEDQVRELANWLSSYTKERRQRTKITKAQRKLLEEEYLQDSRPNPTKLKEICERVEIEASVVRTWFCNRRQKTKLADNDTRSDHEESCSSSQGSFSEPRSSQ